MGYLGRTPTAVPIDASDIPANSITSDKIKDGVITVDDIGANAVGNSEMADDAVGVAELSATGTASSSTYLRGDNSWATLTGASLDVGDTFNNPNDISADVTTTLVTTKNHMLIGDITVSGTATWTVAGSGELKII